jgi:hypothetical protein
MSVHAHTAWGDANHLKVPSQRIVHKDIMTFLDVCLS